MDREFKVEDYVAQLESNPYDLSPLGRLEEEFNSKEGIASLVGLLESRASSASSPDAAARLYLEAARLASTALNDGALSETLLGLSLDVGDETLVSLEAYLFQLAMANQTEQLGEYFAQLLEHDSDQEYQSRLYQRMGVILEAFVGDQDEADQAYQYAWQLNPKNLAALWSRQKLARKRSAWDELADLLIEEIEAIEEPRRQAELSVTVGLIYRDYLDSMESAEQCFAFAYEQDPTNREAQIALREMGYDVEVDAPEAESEKSDGEVLAEEVESESQEIDESSDSIEFAQIVVDEDDQEDAPMTMELDEAMLIEAAPAADVPELPELPEEALAAQDGEMKSEEELAEEFEVLEPEGGVDSEVEEVSEVEEAEELAQAPSLEEAFEEEEAIEESLEEESEEEFAEESSENEIAEEAEELVAADLEDSAEELVELVEVESEEEEEAQAQRTWRDRFGQLCIQGENELEAQVRAARLLARHRDESTQEDALKVWDLAIASGMAAEFYAQTNFLYSDEDLWKVLVERLGEAGDKELRARVLLFDLKDEEAARAAAEEAEAAIVLQALEDLEEGRANWRKLQRQVEKEYEDLDGDDKNLKVYLRMADLARAMDDQDKEIDALRRLERQVDDELVSNRLMELYRATEKWPMYVDLLKKEADGLGEEFAEDQVDILYEIIRVYRTEMNHDRMAINIYKEILGINPEDLRAIDELIELYDTMNMSSDLISMLQSKAELVEGKGAKVEIYSDIAQLFLEKFRNQAEAIKAYEQVLEIEPYHGDAIAFLKEMYEKRREWESLIDIHKREIETFESAEEKIAGLKEVAELATERLRKPEVATELWLEVREVAPQDGDALDALEALYEKSRDFEALAEVLEQKASLSDDDEEKIKLYQKLGMLYSDRLEDSQRAIDAWRAALELQPDDLKARKALERLYIDNRQWDDLEEFYAASDAYSDLVRILGTLTGTIKEDEVKIELLLRSARIWRVELDDTPRAERELERALQIDEQNQAAAAQLEPIYAEAGDYEKLQGVLEIVLSHLSEPAERREYQLKIGRLRRDQFDDWGQAYSWMSKAYQEVPANRESVAELEVAAAKTGAWPQLVRVYQQALEQELEVEDMLATRQLLGRVLSEEVNELDEALEQFQAILDVEEDNLKALAAMEDIYRRSERWDELMTVYRHRLELESDVDARIGILQGMAQIAEVEAEDNATAIERLNEALELDRRNQKTLAELHRLYALEEEYADLADIIRQEIDLIERLARLPERRRERVAVDPADFAPEFDSAATESVFGAGFDAGEESIDDVMSGLREEDGFAAFEEDGEEVALEEAEVLAEEAELEEGTRDLEAVDLEDEPFYLEEEIEALSALRYELGIICKDELGEVDEAVQALGKVLSWRPGHEEARAAVETLLEDGLYQLAVARILEPVYEVRGEWEALVQVLEIQARDAEEVEAKRELYRRIAQILLVELGEGERSFDAYGEVLRLKANDEDARMELYRIAHELELWDGFVDLYEEILPELEEEELRVDYFLSLADVNAQFRAEYDEAERYLEEVYALRPESMRALDDLEELFITTASWQDLLGVMDRKIKLTEEAEAVESLRFRKARVWEEMLEDPHQAIGIYLEILEARADNLEAYANLDRLYEREGMYNELASNLEQQLELVEGEDRREVKNRLARVMEAHLENADGAVDLYEEVLEEDPENAGANQAMEELMGLETAPQGRISRILEPLYVERGDSARLIEALEVQVQVSVDPIEQVQLLHRIAALYEQEQGDLANAFGTYARALAEDLRDEATLGELYRLAEQTQSFEELIQVFEEQAEEQTDPDLKRDMLRRAAALYIEPLGELRLATERLHAVLDLFPADLETVEELEEIYRHTQEWPELVEILVTKADLVDDLEQKQELFHQAGTLYEDILSSPEEAIGIYHRALVVDEADAHAIDRLEVLYTSLEQWYDLLDVYRHKLDLATEDSARIDLYYVMGAIYQEHLEQPQDAIETYRQVLDLDGTERGALEKLDELFEATEQWHELLETLEQTLQLATIAEEQETLKYRMGRLWEVHLGDSLRAVELFAEVLAANPDQQAAIEALEGLVERGESAVEAARVLEPLYQAKQEWTKLVYILRLLIGAAHDPVRQVELYKEVAQIQEERLQDQPEAFATYVEALGVEPGSEEIADNLERIARDLGGWEILIEQIDARLADLSDFEVAAALQLRVARIYEEELYQAQPAIERFQRVMEIEPSSEPAILALDRLYQSEGQWVELVEILKTRIYHSDDPQETLELRLRLGILQQSALDDAEAAITTYQEVLLEDPDNGPAIENLEQMFMEGQEVDRIADILEPYYSERGQHEKLVEIYLQRLGMLEDPFERFDLLMQVARIFLDELDDPARGMQAYGAALRERPDEEHTLAEIERLAEETHNWGSAAEYLIDALESEENTDDSLLGLWLRLARILESRLGQIEDAENAYRQALEIDPAHEESLQALDRIYLSLVRWPELASILARRIESTYDEFEVVELTYRLAQIFQNQLGDFEQAVANYERIVSIQPDHEEALGHLEQIHTALQAWQPLYEVLEQQSQLTHDPDEQAQLFGRMASIAEELLEQREDAVDLWKRVADLQPTNREALHQLRRLYLEGERWQDLVDVLTREVGLATDPQEQLGLFESLGTIYGDYLQDEMQAQDAWTAVLSIDPHHLIALQWLKVLTTRQADYQQLTEIIERLIAHVDVSQEERLALWEELGRVQGDTLMNAHEAIEAWKNVISLNPEHPTALDELERLFLQESRWEEAAHILEVKVDRTVDDEERIELLSRIADLWENKVFERPEAIRFYQQILAIDPRHMPASYALEAIYQEQGTEDSAAALASLYLDRAEILEELFERTETLRNAARVFEEQLRQPDNALVVLLSAYVPETLSDEGLSADLTRLARQTGMWSEVVGRCEAILDAIEDSPEAADLHKQVGQWQVEELGQPEEAIYHLRRALMIEPDNLEVMQLLEKLYRQLSSWPELAQTLHDQVGLIHDPDEQIDVWRKLGEIYEMQLGDIDQAVTAYREILIIDPSDFLAMESLERVFDAFQRWEELVEVLQMKASSTYDPELIIEIKSRAAQVWEEELQFTSQAIATYQEILDVDQSYMPALGALERLYMQTGQWGELAQIYDQQLAMTHEPQDQITIYGKMAWVYEEHFQDLHRAVDAYNQVLMVDVENVGAIENLSRLYRELEQWFELSDMLQRHIELAQSAPEQMALYIELGRLQRDQIQDPHAAIEALERALSIQPFSPNIWSELAQLHEDTNNWERAVEAYDRLVEQLDEPEMRVEVYYRRGQLLEGQLHDHAGAEEAYMAALHMAPTHPDVLDAVRRLLDIQQDWQTLIRVLKAAEDAERDLDKKGELLCEIGAVYEENVGDEVSALRYYEEALEHNPRNPLAAVPLIENYIREQRYERAAPLLEMVLQQYDGLEVDREELHRRTLQLAQSYKALTQPERALEQFHNAYELSPTDLVTLQGLGELLYEQEEWSQAARVLQDLQLHHEARLERSQLVEVFYRLGSIRLKLNDLRSAAQYFDRALEVEQYHQPTLESRVEVAKAQSKWDEVVHFTRWLLETEQDPTVRFAHLVQIGDILATKMQQGQQAVGAYQEALELDPQSVAILRKMLDLYTRAQQWHEAVEVLLRIVAQEDNASRASKYYYTAAVIYRDEIQDPMKAVEFFNKALDADVKMLKAFEAIDRILTELKDWRELSRAYRTMLHRLSETSGMEEVQFLLLTNLGEIYRTRRDDMETAIGAYELAVGLRPEAEETRLILAELYERTGRTEGVIEQHRELIKLNEFRVESYRTLFKSYIQAKEYDKAWCMAGALSFLRKATEQEETFFRKYLGTNLQASTASFNQGMFRTVTHPAQDTLITYIMSILGQGLIEMYSGSSVRDLGLHRRRDKVDLEEPTLFNKIYVHITQTLNLLPAPQVYLKGDQALGMRNANIMPATVVIGGDVRQKANDRELAFIIAKSLTWMLPQHYIGSIGQPTEFLRLLFMALMDLTAPNLGIGQTLGEQGQEVKATIAQMPPQLLMQAQKGMQKFLEKGENPNLSQWLVAVEHTAIRVGLLLCGDIHTAAACIESDLAPVGKASVKEKIRELVLFSISEEYFELRQSLGLAIGS